MKFEQCIILKLFPSLNILKFFPILSLEIFLNYSLNIKGVTSPRNIFQSFLMFYYIIKLSKNLCFVSIMQKDIRKKYHN